MLESDNTIEIGVVYSLPETVLNKPQPPTPSTSMSDDLFYRLQKENALLPPQVKMIINEVIKTCTYSFYFVGLYCFHFSTD